ncbi:MAG: hypothetical protein R3E34_08105 [Rhodocyclaceae bacterium]
MENLTRTRHRIALVGKAGDAAGGFEEKGQGRRIELPPEPAGCVARGLGLMSGDVLARLIALGFDDANGLAIDEQNVVGRAGIGGVFAHSHAPRGAEVQGTKILHLPSSQGKACVDIGSGFGFGRHSIRTAATNSPRQSFRRHKAG